MVKPLDDNEAPPEHLGLRLWQANKLWLDALVGAMQARGHAWFGIAQANLLGHLDRGGTAQSELASRLGTSKQAVQQLLDPLVGAGILARLPDPADARARIVVYTGAGRAALADADAIKQELQLRIAARMGVRDAAELERLLDRLLALGTDADLPG